MGQTPNEKAEADLPNHQAEDLLRGGKTAIITLDGQIYTLRLTRQGKLLLTK